MVIVHNGYNGLTIHKVPFAKMLEKLLMYVRCLLLNGQYFFLRVRILFSVFCGIQREFIRANVRKMGFFFGKRHRYGSLDKERTHKIY